MWSPSFRRDMHFLWDYQMWHDSFVWVTRLIYMGGMTHSYRWYDSFTCDNPLVYLTLLIRAADVTWLIHMSDTTHSYVTTLLHTWHDSFVRPWSASRLIHTGDMTHSCVTTPHSSVTWLLHAVLGYDVAHLCVRQDSFKCVTGHIHIWHDFFTGLSSVGWLIHVRDKTHSYVTTLLHIWHNSFLGVSRVRWLIRLCSWLIHTLQPFFTCAMTPSWGSSRSTLAHTHTHTRTTRTSTNT